MTGSIACCDTTPIQTEQPTKEIVTTSQTTEYIIYFLFGVLETLLAFRLIFKLAGASHTSSFVNIMYAVTGIFILPFEGIFHKVVNQGIETSSIMEPSTLVALVVYAILSFGMVKLVSVLSREKQVES